MADKTKGVTAEEMLVQLGLLYMQLTTLRAEYVRARQEAREQIAALESQLAEAQKK